MTTPLNIPRIKSRLTKYLDTNQDAFNRILCQILHNNDYCVQKIAFIAGLNLTNVRRILKQDLSDRDYAAYAYAMSEDRTEEWNDLGKAFLKSMPQVTPEEAEYHLGFIVECMKWGTRQ